MFQIDFIYCEYFGGKEQGQVFYFDIDSIFLTPEHVELVQEFFQPLNPYDMDVMIFKIEKMKIVIYWMTSYFI